MTTTTTMTVAAARAAYAASNRARAAWVAYVAAAETARRLDAAQPSSFDAAFDAGLVGWDEHDILTVSHGLEQQAQAVGRIA